MNTMKQAAARDAAGTSGRFVTVVVGDSPLVAVALHDGHVVGESLRPLYALSESERLREEDPFTGRWTRIAPTQFVAGRSRFEVDLNRPREHAVYLQPEEAWGLTVWRETPPPEILHELRSNYDLFYDLLENVLSWLVDRHGRVVVLDLHTYNHLRRGPNGPPTDPRRAPDVNIGTGSMDRATWGAVVDRFIADLSRFPYLGRHLDVRENVCFRGGEMSRWIHKTFPDSVCAIAIEVKKFFMDEWTGEADEHQLIAIEQALASTVPGLLEELRRAGE